MELADPQRESVAESEKLLPFADRDGIVASPQSGVKGGSSTGFGRSLLPPTARSGHPT